MDERKEFGLFCWFYSSKNKLLLQLSKMMKFFATGEHWKTDFEKPAKFAPSVGSKVVCKSIHQKGDSRPMDQRNYENQFLRDYKEPLRKRHETD